MTDQTKLYKSTDKIWVNAAGDEVPRNYVSKAEQRKEVLAGKVYAAALDVEEALTKLHALIDNACKEVNQLIREQYQVQNGKAKKEGKGNLTWYSFDNSIKIESSVDEVVKWDDAMMAEARQLLNQYLDSQLTDNQALIKKLVNDAFSNSKGTIDSRKVFQLLKYENEINSSNFRKACAIMRDAQMVDRTKLYMRVWARQADGSYRNINLNFSSL